jgi:curli biogenesis system outer membrane secretion channel CsgG
MDSKRKRKLVSNILVDINVVEFSTGEGEYVESQNTEKGFVASPIKWSIIFTVNLQTVSYLQIDG